MPLTYTNPTVGGDNGAWGTKLNTILDDIKALVNSNETKATNGLPTIGLASERPAAPNAEGQMFWATDTEVLSVAYETATAGTYAWDTLANFTPFRARVYNSTNQVLTAGPDVLTWDSESLDSDAVHDPATNPERLTVPAGSSGLVQVQCYVRVYRGSAALTAGPKVLRIFKNATEVAQYVAFADGTPTTESVPLTLTYLDEAVAGDYYHATIDADLDEVAYGGSDQSYFQIVQLGA